jgi:large subunit ribosomal protein L13
MNRQTTLAKNEVSPQEWYVLDATDLILGRISTKIAMILMGKNKPTYTPHHLVGDAVVVINADKIRMTGSKAEQKMFQTYVFYPSGQKNFSYKWMLENKPELLLQRSVRRMLPKNKLAAKMLKNLKIYKGGEHPHQANSAKTLTL